MQLGIAAEEFAAAVSRVYVYGSSSFFPFVDEAREYIRPFAVIISRVSESWDVSNSLRVCRCAAVKEKRCEKKIARNK